MEENTPRQFNFFKLSNEQKAAVSWVASRAYDQQVRDRLANGTIEGRDRFVAMEEEKIASNPHAVQAAVETYANVRDESAKRIAGSFVEMTERFDGIEPGVGAHPFF